MVKINRFHAKLPSNTFTFYAHFISRRGFCLRGNTANKITLIKGNYITRDK